MRLRFGPFTLERASRQLLRGGESLHLSPKAFELLLLLVESRPAALSKADLQARLWPDTFVSEANLPGLVKEIRKVLDDDSREPRFVRTLHAFGYAFCAAAGELPDLPLPHRAAETTFWIVADRQIQLSEGENVLGRDTMAAVWFDGPGVSRRHARIVVSGEDAVLEDLGSKNGTYLRGERLAGPARLFDGDEIRVGSVAVTLRVRKVAGSTETQEW
jgi:DNA-binding winged helix-turn-helix (wHTH) protein